MVRLRAYSALALFVFDVGDEYVCKPSTLAKVAEDVPANTKGIHAISINALIADFRATAKAAGVPLPDRLTPRFGSDEWAKWRETVDDEKQVEAARAYVKDKKERADKAQKGRADLVAAVAAQGEELKRMREQVEAQRREFDTMLGGAKKKAE
jgi:hypothetical protein